MSKNCLKNCPFCGGKPLRFESHAHWIQIICRECGCRAPLLPDPEKAVSIWNRREEQERKRGLWIVVNDAYNRISGKCSACGWEAHLYEDDVVGMDYCPNCGAKMENYNG